MADRFDFKFLGDRELSAKLRALPEKLERKILAQSLRKVMKEIVLPPIVAATPIGRPYIRVVRGRTVKTPTGSFRRIRFRRVAGGRLRASYRVRALRPRKARVGTTIQAGGRAALGIRGRGYYPAHVHMGFSPRSGKTDLPANKYMGDPLRNSKAVWLESLAQQMRAGLDREVK